MSDIYVVESLTQHTQQPLNTMKNKIILISRRNFKPLLKFVTPNLYCYFI